jgi:hypothetical protein
MKKLIVVTILLMFIIAQGIASETSSTKRIGLGLQSAPFPIFGLSGIYNISKQWSAQTIFRYKTIDVDFLSFRCLYRFKQTENHSLYVNSLLGYFYDDSVSEEILGPEQTDSALGFGFGFGFEYFFKSLPEIGWNVEVDYIRINFEEKWWDYDYKPFSLIMLGLGINYYF